MVKITLTKAFHKTQGQRREHNSKNALKTQRIRKQPLTKQQNMKHQYFTKLKKHIKPKATFQTPHSCCFTDCVFFGWFAHEASSNYNK